MNNTALGHDWIHQTAPRGHGSHYFYAGDTIYSYGYHFPIARRLDNKTVLFTTQSYSNSTARHVSLTRSAIPDSYQVFTVSNVLACTAAQHRANFVGYGVQLRETLADFGRSRTQKNWHARQLVRLLKEGNEYKARFKVRGNPLTLPGGTSPEALREQADKAHTEHIAREHRKQVALEGLNKERIAAWIRGESIQFSSAISRIYLRAIGKVMQTSRGAEVDLLEAERAYRLVARCRQTHQSREKNGERITVGKFELDSIDKDGNVKAGCHNLDWTEIERFAKTQNWSAKHD